MMHDRSNSRFLIRRHPRLGAFLILTTVVLLFIQYNYWWRFTPVEVNEENFPDPVFRDYVSSNLDDDKDGMLSRPELRAVKEMDVSSWRVKLIDTDGARTTLYDSEFVITDLKGIEYFAAVIIRSGNWM